MRDPIVALRAMRADRGHHAGLLLQRYLCEVATGDEGNPREKRAILQAAMQAATRAEPIALYRAAFERWKASLPADARCLDLRTSTRLIVGLGTENVLETGIRLHHTYGMPVIPGSALKGLAAHYCDQVWRQANPKFKKPTKEEDEAYVQYLRGKRQPPDDNFHRLLFGTTDDAGCIVFHDAWITPASLEKGALRLDVMTPHHPAYQHGPEDRTFKAPTDFDSPVPVPFLSVAGWFHVAVSWNGPASDRSQRWVDLALELLKAALADWGIGGKTSSGYGRLIDATARTRAPAGRRLTEPVASLPRAKEHVEAILLEEKTKKGGWKARHEPSGLAGPIQNSREVPAEKQPGQIVTLIVASVNEREIAFRYPTASDKHRPDQSPRKTKRSSGFQNRR